MEVSKASAMRCFALLLGSLTLLVWIGYSVSNRDPFLLGGCLVATLAACPSSILLIALASRTSVDSKWRLSLWALLLLNAGILITILGLLLYGWSRRG